MVRFATSTDSQKLKALIRCSVRAGFYTSDPDYDFADQRLFNTILESPCHVLEQLLPPALTVTELSFQKMAAY